LHKKGLGWKLDMDENRLIRKLFPHESKLLSVSVSGKNSKSLDKNGPLSPPGNREKWSHGKLVVTTNKIIFIPNLGNKLLYEVIGLGFSIIISLFFIKPGNIESLLLGPMIFVFCIFLGLLIFYTKGGMTLSCKRIDVIGVNAQEKTVILKDLQGRINIFNIPGEYIFKVQDNFDSLASALKKN
jgi:hypothetical protein